MKTYTISLIRILLFIVISILAIRTNAQSNPQSLIDISCPCNGPAQGGGSWRNHGEYVSCVTQSVEKLVASGIIRKDKKGTYVTAAAESSCGKPSNYPTTDEKENSNGVLTLLGDLEKSIQPVASNLKFSLNGSSFSLLKTDYSIEINGSEIVPENVVLSNLTASFSILLNNGKNEIAFFGLDQSGYSLVGKYTIWAGTQNLPVTILNADGTNAGNATVKISLSDDPSLTAEKSITNGTVIFQNLPTRTILISAKTSDNRFATAAVVPTGIGVTLKLIPFNAPSLINNNNFELGTDGWNIGNSVVTIIPHFEGNSTLKQGSILKSLVDNDLQLITSGEGPRSISRTFNTMPGTTSVKVRFKFVTSEVPGGYFGSQFNDYYAISLRSQLTGKQEADQNSMNGLGLSAFDPIGATSWRELVLPVASTGDIVQLDITVANVGDGVLDSWVITDYVDEKKLSITKLDLFDIDNTTLNYISLDNHAYFNGQSRINGTITISGLPGDKLTGLTLEGLQGGVVVAKGKLASSAQALLFQNFNANGIVEITNSQLLFEIPSGITISGNVQLRIVASTATDDVTKDWKSPKAVNRYMGANRYGGRDEDKGGDDWALQNIVSYVNGLSSSWLFGDFSNMNAGTFQPDHAGHSTGDEVDAWFANYNDRNATTAQTLITFLNSAAGSRISRLGVTFTPSFATAISNVTLADGRKATDVIRNWAGHTTHFHLNIIHSGNGNRLISPDFDDPANFWKNWSRQRNGINVAKTRPLNILDPLIYNRVEVYPNPAQNVINIQHKLANKKTNASFVIADLYGKVLSITLLNSNVQNSKINVEQLKNGIYFYKLIQNNAIIGNGKFTLLK